MRLLLVGAAVLSAIVFLSLTIGCEENQSVETVISATAVAVVAGVGTPVADVAIVLLDAERGLPVAPAGRTDTTGTVTFSRLDDGRYLWALLPGQGWVSSRPPGEAVLASSKTTPIDPHILELLPAAAGGAMRVYGTVVDDATGEPLSGVVIGLPGWPDGWAGSSPASGGLSDAEGAFAVADIVFVAGIGGEDPFQFHPLIFQRDGYRPEARRFDVPVGGGSEILGVEVRLVPMTEIETGSVSARVVFLGEPVAGLDVLASWVGGTDKSWLSHPGFVVTTDTSGLFVMDGLAPGPWLLEPGFRPDDGWLLDRFASTAGGILPAMILAGSTVTIPDLPLLQAVAPIYPLPGAVGVDSLATFSWAAVAEADSFDVFIGRWYFGRTDKMSLGVPEDFPLSPGAWSWHVNAVTSSNILVGSSESIQRFVVSPTP